MTVSLAQVNGAASSSGSPTSIAVVNSATGVGNLLVMGIVAAGTSSPTISTPGGWTLLQTSADSQKTTGLYSYQNNPGDLTTITANLTNATGASAIMFEFAGVAPTSLEGSYSSGLATSTINPIMPPLNNINQVGVWMIGGVSTPVTPILTNEWAPYYARTSTGGSPNSVLYIAYHINAMGPGTPQNGGTLTLADVYQSACRFNTVQSSPVPRTPVGGGNGMAIYVGQFNQGMIGG